MENSKSIIKFLKECGVFFLLTENGNKPAGRPFGAVTEADGDLYVATSANKAVYRQMKENHAVQIIALKSGTRDWCRIDGCAEECRDLSRKQKMLDDCPNLSKHYSSPQDEKFCLIRIGVKNVETFFTGERT